MKKRDILYRIPALYHFFMRLLYGENFASRYAAISKFIPERAAVVEICCGDCYLYEKHLKSKNVSYLGLDISISFVKNAQKKKINARVFDITTDALPKAEYVIMQGSLYQFIPRQSAILDKIFNAADKGVIIAEPIKNWSDINNPLVLSFVKKLSTWLAGPVVDRFDENSLNEVFSIYKDRLIDQFRIDGDRELVSVFNINRI